MIDFKKQLEDGQKSAADVKIEGKYDLVIFCGMGGSAIPGKMISMLWLDNLNVYIHGGYGVPYWADSSCLVICTSWSGNTEETISAYDSALKKGIPRLVVTKGGRLAELARRDGSPLIILPADDVPARLGIGYVLGAILTLLNDSDIIDYTLPDLAAIKAAESGQGLSSKISQKAPLIYSSYAWRYLAGFWKINFNENSKVHSFSNYFPEAAHNEIAGFNQTNRDQYFPLILMDPEEEKADIDKLNKFVLFLKGRKIDHEVIEVAGKNRLEKILNSYNLAISASMELARILGAEPLDNSTIEQFKKT